MSNPTGGIDSLLPGDDWPWPVTSFSLGLLGDLLPLQVGSKVWVERECVWPGPDRPNNTVSPDGPGDLYVPVGPDDPGSPDSSGCPVGASAANGSPFTRTSSCPLCLTQSSQ